MQPGTPEVVGILAGGGALPAEIAAAAAAAGRRVVVVGLAGEADPAQFTAHDFTLLRWGEIGALIRTFKKRGVRDLVIVGSVSRPDMSRLKTDLGFYLNLPRILRIMAAGGDDHVLRRVVRFFEGNGFQVLGPAEIAPGLAIAEGPLGKHTPAANDLTDIAAGFDLVARLAAFDIGQAVAIANGKVLAIEGAEGTDAMLERIGERQGPEGGVLIKRPKPGQELRVDMPAIGPRTVARARAAGLRGIAVEAGVTLAAERAALIAAANDAGLFVTGIPPGRTASAPRLTLARNDPAADGLIGAGVLRALAPTVPSRGAVVMRRHVLAVEAGEGITALIARAGRLRQWGRSRLSVLLGSGRRGVLTVSGVGDLAPGDINAGAALGLTSIQILDPEAARHARWKAVHDEALRTGMILTVAPAASERTAP